MMKQILLILTVCPVVGMAKAWTPKSALTSANIDDHCGQTPRYACAHVSHTQGVGRIAICSHSRRHGAARRIKLDGDFGNSDSHTVPLQHAQSC